jgi:two-component system chemotaxis response regulator CheY
VSIQDKGATIRRAQDPRTVSKRLPKEGLMGKKLLVVDDSVSMRNVVGMTLRGAGYDVIEACDGKDALSKLTGEKLNLIITDINMPNMDGISFVKEVKKLAAYKFTPIMMLTTETEQTKRDQARAAGAKAWVTKPFQPEQMLDTVAKLVLP